MVHFITYRRKEFLKDLVIIFLIVLTPLIIYVHLFVPETQTLKTPFFTIESNYYKDIQSFIWTLSIKLTFIISYSFWFITCKHWWRNALLIPIIIYINQLIVVLNDEIRSADHTELFQSIVVSIPIILLLAYISKKLNYYSKSKQLTEELDIEIRALFEDVSKYTSKDYQIIRQEVTSLRHKKNSMEKKTYLAKLIALRDSLD